MGAKSSNVFVDEGASTPIGGAFSWPLGGGDAVQVLGGGGGGDTGRPMPFDIEASIETDQGGTAQRVIIKCFPGAVVWNGFKLIAANISNKPSASDSGGWVTVHTGEWQSSPALFDQGVWLTYKITLTPEWTTNPVTFGAGTTVLCEVVVTTSTQSPTNPYGDEGLHYLPNTQILIGHISLGEVIANLGGDASRATVKQRYHGDLFLGDILQYGGDDGGGGEDATKGTAYPMPFQYKRTDTEDPETGEITSSYAITNCNFYWDGVYYSIGDFVPPATGSVYLKATKQGTGAGAWSFELTTSPVANPTGNNQTIRLYDFSGSRIVMDYRTTTLTFGPGPRDYFEVVKSGSSAKVSLDATGTATHSVVISTADATRGDVRLRECSFYGGSSSTPEKVNILASKVLTLGAPPDLAAVTGVSFKIENNKLKATLNKANLRTGATSTSTVDVCDVHELNVVTNTDYTNPNFTQSKQSVTVIGAAPSSSDPPKTVFTTTPLDAELTS